MGSSGLPIITVPVAWKPGPLFATMNAYKWNFFMSALNFQSKGVEHAWVHDITGY